MNNATATATTAEIDNRPHPWDPARIGNKGVAHHLIESFRKHVVEDPQRRQAMRQLMQAVSEADAAAATPVRTSGAFTPGAHSMPRTATRTRCTSGGLAR